MPIATIDWSTWLPASCYPTACFCERVGAGLIRQPANTWSSLLFLVPAAMAWAARRSNRGHRLASRYAVSLAIIGLGSAFFHASLTFVGQTIDNIGMYLLVTLIAVTAAERSGLVAVASASRLFWVTNLVLAALLVTVPIARRPIFAALAVVAVGLEWRARGGISATARRYLIGGVAALAVGFVIWILDITGALCRPTSLIQGHAAWHGLAALAAWLHWRFATARDT